jgi:hypothetical protein
LFEYRIPWAAYSAIEKYPIYYIVMPQVLESAKATLSYPLYACDFDPNDATTLVVGGGGGSGKSGVGNKIVSYFSPHG